MEKQFSEFVLTVDPAPSDEELEGGSSAGTSLARARALAAGGGAKLTGSYALLGDVLTRFSDHCTNTVTQTSTVPKAEIQVDRTRKQSFRET